MTETEFNTTVKQLRDLEKQIQDADVKARVHEARLMELRPKREEIEHQSVELFGCSVKDLPAKIASAEQNFALSVSKLAADVDKISGGA